MITKIKIQPTKGLVSVVVPLYNGTASICRCLNSILSQTYERVEILVVDDGSTDNSLEVIAHYGNKIILLQQENRGPAAARNLGIKEGTGEFLTFLDSDDYWLPTFLAKSIAVLSNLPQVIAVSTSTKAVHWSNKTTTIPSDIHSKKWSRYKEGKVIPDFFTFWAREDHIRTGSVVINTINFPELPLQHNDLRISEDLEYWGLLATYGEWAFLPEVLFVTDGGDNAASVGWIQKNKTRRKLCPTVHLWQKRIIARVQDKDQTGFKRMRGRIAGNFAHAKILAGNYSDARKIIQKYGSEFQHSTITTIMKRGNQLTWLGWIISCYLLHFREWLKATLISARYTIQQRSHSS